MIWLLFGIAAVLGFSKTGKTNKRPKAAKGSAKIQGRECIIEYGGKFWDGAKFTKNRSAAKRYPNNVAAWNYVDGNFADDVAEDCGLETMA